MDLRAGRNSRNPAHSRATGDFMQMQGGAFKRETKLPSDSSITWPARGRWSYRTLDWPGSPLIAFGHSRAECSVFEGPFTRRYSGEPVFEYRRRAHLCLHLNEREQKGKKEFGKRKKGRRGRRTGESSRFREQKAPLTTPRWEYPRGGPRQSSRKKHFRGSQLFVTRYFTWIRCWSEREILCWKWNGMLKRINDRLRSKIEA